MKTLMDLVIRGNNKETAARVEELLNQGASPDSLMKEAMIPAMDEVGAQFQKGEIYLPEMLLAAWTPPRARTSRER
jgi:5-methyltetrahydrofolate--homocysteine methyltransferase